MRFVLFLRGCWIWDSGEKSGEEKRGEKRQRNGNLWFREKGGGGGRVDMILKEMETEMESKDGRL